MARSPLTPAGRGALADHPDVLRMEREAIAGLREEDRLQADREEAILRAERDAVVADDGLDRYDRAELEYDLMSAGEHRGDYDDWGRSR